MTLHLAPPPREPRPWSHREILVRGWASTIAVCLLAVGVAIWAAAGVVVIVAAGKAVLS